MRDKIAGTKLAERKVQFEAVEDRNFWVTFGIDERAQVQDSRLKLRCGRTILVECWGI